MHTMTIATGNTYVGVRQFIEKGVFITVDKDDVWTFEAKNGVFVGKPGALSDDGNVAVEGVTSVAN